MTSRLSRLAARSRVASTATASRRNSRNGWHVAWKQFRDLTPSPGAPFPRRRPPTCLLDAPLVLTTIILDFALPARRTGKPGAGGQGIPADARFKPGSGGQLIAFVPSLDLVIARQTGGSGGWDYEGYLRLACEAVLPSAGGKGAASPDKSRAK